jgi:phosphoribosylformylglycinamidine (FGAM) synthase PurS component
MAENKQQHFVAKSYLKSFCLQNTESVYRFDLVASESKKRNIEKIFREPYFYADGSVAPIFELALSALEDKQGQTIQQILKTQTLTITSLKDFMYLHLSVLITKTRTKASREQIEDMARSSLIRKLPYLAESEMARES